MPLLNASYRRELHIVQNWCLLLCREVKMFPRRPVAAFGVAALPGGKIGVIFLIPWHGRDKGDA